MFLTFAAFAVAVLSAAAQTQSRPPKPYATVAIVPPAASDDESFAEFRTSLAAVAKSRVYVDLAPLVTTHGFFWDRDFDRGFDPRKPDVDNLAAAIRLEHGNGSGWRMLATMAAEVSVEPLVSRPGVVCAPARPSYDGIAFTRLLNATYTTITDWAYPRAAKTPVRAAPKLDAALAGTLGLNFTLLLGFEGSDGDPSPGRSQWARIATPDAKTGYVAPNSLLSLTAERLCYIKELVGGWRIAGYIAGEN